MRRRVDILTDLVAFDANLKELRTELSKYPWDTDKPYLIISKLQFSNVLNKCIKRVITFQELEDWANTIECRDDLDFEDEIIQEFLFELSSPEINGEITDKRLCEMLNVLSTNKC